MCGAHKGKWEAVVKKLPSSLQQSEVSCNDVDFGCGLFQWLRILDIRVHLDRQTDIRGDIEHFVTRIYIGDSEREAVLSDNNKY